MSEIAPSPEPPPANAAGAEPSLRHLAETALQHLLGEEGYQSIRGRNWTLVGVGGPVIGIVSDVLQIFGPIASIALLVSASVFTVSLLLVVFRTRFCRACAFPCVLALLLVVIFAMVVGAQRLAAANEPAARDTGALAAAIPGIADLQSRLIDVAARLGVMDRHLREVADTTQRTDRKVDAVAQKIDALPETLAKLLAQASDAEKAALHTEVDRLRQAGDIRDQAIVTFLKDVGETPLSADQYPAQLVRFAERYRSLLAEAEKPKNLPAQFEVVRREAAEKIKAGELDKADALLASLRMRMAQWRQDQQAALDRASRDEATVLGERAGIAKTRLRYRDAAALYAEAADLVGFDPKAKWGYRLDQADASYRQGEEFGDNSALSETIDVYRNALTLAPRSREPLDWATTQNNLGAALGTLGAREGGTVRLEEAVEAYREALKEYTREREPLDWAMAQNNLGNALMRLGEREGGPARLEAAAAAYREALTERTRERVPLDWAMTQNNLGNALSSLGMRESGTGRLEEAVAAYRDALKEYSRERVPLRWAATQNNLGNALGILGERESGTARLEEAVEAYRAALTERTRGRVPLDWAGTHNNLGVVLKTLGERESGTARLEEAVAAYRAASEEWTRERVPYYWAQTQENLAIVFHILAVRTTGETRLAYLADALTAVDGALEVYREGNAAYNVEEAERLRAAILAEQQQAQAPPR